MYCLLACFAVREVGGIRIKIEDLAGGVVSDGDIWMSGKVVEQAAALFVGVVRGLELLGGRDCANAAGGGGIEGSDIEKCCSSDGLDAVDACCLV